MTTWQADKKRVISSSLARVTLDIYSLALPPAKRVAQSKVVNMILHKVVPRGYTADSDPIRANG